MDNLHPRIAKALGWTLEKTRTLSLPNLRELVRPVDPKLAEEISRVVQSGSFIRQPQ